MSCDWGSSSFRLRLVNISGQEIVEELFAEDGAIQTYNLWGAEKEKTGISQKQFFLNQLKTHTDTLALKSGINLHGITIVVSGMASSSIGLQELPYATLPFALDGNGAVVASFSPTANFSNPILLISGARGDNEVIRGEETQLIGLADQLDLAHHEKEVILILPGTHSKHLCLRNGQLVDLKTFMTGEIFSLVSDHSILKNSIETILQNDVSSDGNKEAFRLGVKASADNDILNALFSVRTNQLFNKLSKKENAFYLSGLLIGSELSQLRTKENALLYLCSSGNLQELYQLALHELGLLKNTTIVLTNINQATIAGQIKILSTTSI